MFLSYHTEEEITCGIGIEMIDKQDIGDAGKTEKANEEHFDLEVTMTPESNEDPHEQTQCTEDFAVRRIYADCETQNSQIETLTDWVISS